ncbi:M20/M25/M40 family metallo-hydrolase [Neobacillus sp. FSL H8-0543]|uniref:M20 family metallopeptidase n=1 Tax=Neobacillus sp. FSL H8-0543 TaxID=2954672 RepID=UPI0031581EC8
MQESWSSHLKTDEYEIEVNSIISLTTRLIQFETTTKENINLAVDYCSEWLRQRGIETTFINNDGYKSLIAEIGEKGPIIIFNGHLDVVPAEADQFFPFVDDGKIYGRGSFDMLGAVSVMMHAFVELSKKTLPARVILSLVPDEETGGEKGTGYLVENGILGDMVICGETTNLDIAVQAKGILQISLEFLGTASHGSRPWLGENAILKAFHAYKEIERLDLFKEKSQFFDRPSINLARIHGGGAINRVPDRCSLILDIRYLPDQNPEDILDQIRGITDAELKIISRGDPVKTNPLNEFVIRLKDTAENVLGSDVRIFGQDGSADTRFYATRGIPAVEFGPRGANHHGKGEYVFINSLLDFKSILIDYVMSYSKKS